MAKAEQEAKEAKKEFAEAASKQTEIRQQLATANADLEEAVSRATEAEQKLAEAKVAINQTEEKLKQKETDLHSLQKRNQVWSNFHFWKVSYIFSMNKMILH